MFFKNYRAVIFVGAVILAAVFLFSYGLKYDTGQSLLQRLALGAAAPVQKLFTLCVESVDNAWTRYIRLVGLEEENRKLKGAIGELQAQLTLYRQGYLESRRLQTLLSLTEREPYRFIAARVIGREQAALAKTLWIDKGEAHGLKPGMPVMAPPGLIGRLTNVSRHSAKVQLLIDEGSNVDVLVERTRQQGMLRGAGSRGCVVRYISKIQDVREGDVILTSGLSNIFPKGLLVGKVVHADRSDAGMFLNIRVSPFADFTSLEEVLVLAGESKAPLGERKAAK
ncbi:MAG: rod shape-determining protein MreC [Smithellaceae bacterium]|jgi:rod shape-determining protein MreC|nr:rod shape-determining protein MreC [Smithellaceae bacterium]